MIKKVVEAVFGSRQDREVKRIQPVLAQIKEHEARLQSLDEATLRAQTVKFRGILAERTDALKIEVDRLRKAKHDCADPVEREGIDAELHKAETEMRAGDGENDRRLAARGVRDGAGGLPSSGRHDGRGDGAAARVEHGAVRRAADRRHCTSSWTDRRDGDG